MANGTKAAKLRRYFKRNPEATAREAAEWANCSYGNAWTIKREFCKTTPVVRSKDYIPKPQVHKTQLSDNAIEYVDGRPTMKLKLKEEVLAEQKRSSLDTELADNSQQASIMQTLAGRSDGSTASYYELPAGAQELQDLISHKNMNAQIGEIFRAAYRYGQSSHSDQLRDAKKIKFYIDAEIKRLGG
tara:strand:+ start:100 stop:660 length:561 start_codon:yes stop_codon:yes gene_type:complete